MNRKIRSAVQISRGSSCVIIEEKQKTSSRALKKEIELTDYQAESVTQNEEEGGLIGYLKTSMFNTLTVYLESCTTNDETRNKSLTLNTVEVILKFLVFDLFAFTTADNQQSIYESLLLILQLDTTERYIHVPHEKKESPLFVPTESRKSNTATRSTSFLAKNRVKFTSESKEVPRGRSSKSLNSRSSANNTILQENLSNMCQRTMHKTSSSSSSTAKQLNIDLKKKILAVLLVYLANQTNSHIERLIKFIREKTATMQNADEERVYRMMRDPHSIL